MYPYDGLATGLGNAYTLFAIISEVVNLFLSIMTWLTSTLFPFLNNLIPTGGATP